MGFFLLTLAYLANTECNSNVPESNSHCSNSAKNIKYLFPFNVKMPEELDVHVVGVSVNQETGCCHCVTAD